MTATVSGRLPEKLVDALDAFGDETGQTRSQVLRVAVERGLAELRLERALDAYRKGNVSLGRGAEMAGIHLSGFIDALRDARIPLHYGLDELREDLEWADAA